MAILFFDIDRTILSEETNTIPPSAAEGLQKAKEKGHLLFINTGRTRCDLSEALKAIPFDGFCCGCGTYLEYQGEALFQHSIPYERGRELIEEMLSYGIEGIMEGTKDLYFQKGPYGHPELERYRQEVALRGLGISVGLESQDFCYDKFVFCYDEPEKIAPFFQMLEADIEVIDYQDGFYECVQKPYSKATAIAFFQDYFQLPLDEVYVFGDSSNDVSMFTYAAHTIAMGRHAEILEPYTEYVTDTVERDGIYKALVHYGLI